MMIYFRIGLTRCRDMTVSSVAWRRVFTNELSNSKGNGEKKEKKKMEDLTGERIDP